MSLEPGATLDGKYRITRLLGKGGMGMVWLAENLRVRRQVAIKVLRKEAASGEGDMLLRFEREAQAAGQIGSDHIVEVLDLGTTDDGDRFMVMEYLEGETLKQRMRKGRVDPAKVSAVFGQLLDGLGAAHAAGIVHRDLKPDNIFLQREKAGHKDWVKILDFGISKFSQLGEDEGRMTRAGTVMGTPYYMSPEQARTAHAVDARSDIYSVGVMLFEVLTGQVPFAGTTFAELLFKIAFEPQPHPRSVQPTLDDFVCGVILRAMERDPAARFQSAAELRAALVEWDARRGSLGLLPAPPPPPTATLPMPPARIPDASDEGLATQLWSGGPTPPPTSGPNLTTPLPAERSQPPSVSQPAGVAGVAGETQQTWNGSSTGAPVRRRGNGLVFAGIGVAVLAASVVAFFALRTSPAEPRPAATTTTTATAATATAAPPALPTPTDTAAPAVPVPTVTATASTTAGAEAAHAARTAPAAKTTAAVKATAAPTAAPGGKKQVVTDYGY